MFDFDDEKYRTEIPKVDPKLVYKGKTKYEPTPGIIIECSKLNILAKPKADSEIICTIDADSKIMIDLGESTYQFYKIYTEAGVEGYCSKNYAAVV